MAKVVLVWNEHPTEVVAGFHARKVAQLLRKRGHEVVVEKIPVSETNYGIVRASANSAELTKRLRKLTHSLEIARRFKEKHKAFAFNFHASKASVLGEAAKKQPDEFTIGHYTNFYDLVNNSEIAIIGSEKHFIVEVPGINMPIPERNAKINRQRISRLGFESQGTNDLQLKYYVEHMPLKHKGQQKYLDPVISEKIAAAIHERISKK